MMELLEYHLGNDVRAFSTLRGDVRADDAYSSFNITHYCGDSPQHVAACRRELCNELSIDDSHLLLPHQIHSDRIVVIDPSYHEVFPQFRQPILPDADAIVTTFPGLCIGVSTADCIPVLLYDVQHRIAAAVHAGWRGAVQRIVSKTVCAMQRIGSEPQYIRAVIGPEKKSSRLSSMPDSTHASSPETGRNHISTSPQSAPFNLKRRGCRHGTSDRAE